MTIKFEKVTRRLKTTICLSGRLQARHLEELKRQTEGTRSRIALDLNGVTLVDVEIIRFLNACEKNGVQLLNCWPYIREWMSREKGGEE
jgi:anti-anti-sigma regulatory factor